MLIGINLHSAPRVTQPLQATVLPNRGVQSGLSDFAMEHVDRIVAKFQWVLRPPVLFRLSSTNGTDAEFVVYQVARNLNETNSALFQEQMPN